MGLRQVQALEDGTDSPIRADHVVGVDESGNPTSGTPYVIAAVQCPRTASESLAELLVEAGLDPWQRKSNSLSAAPADEPEVTARVERLIDLLADSQVTWSAAAGWKTYSPKERAATACRVAKATLTLPNHSTTLTCSGDVLLLHDGGTDVYHPKLRPLRTQAASAFDPSFEAAFSAVYVTSFSKADLTYPEVNTADFIAGYIRDKLRSGTATTHTLPDQVLRIDAPNWLNPTETSPKPLYRVKEGGRNESTTIQTRVLAWMDGRQPPEEDGHSTHLFEQFIEQRLESESLQTYLRSLT